MRPMVEQSLSHLARTSAQVLEERGDPFRAQPSEVEGSKEVCQGGTQRCRGQHLRTVVRSFVA